MKKIFKIAVISVIVGISLAGVSKTAFGQEVKAPAKCPYYYFTNNEIRYQEDGEFLKTCNYLITMQADGANVLVGPHTNYFTNAYSNYPDTQAESSEILHAHFKILKQLGFNSIRIMNADIEPRYDEDKLAIKLWCRGCNELSNPDPVPLQDAVGFYGWVQYENIENYGLNYQIQAMQIILDIASVYDLKVIWVMGTESKYQLIDDVQLYRSLLNSVGNTINEQYKECLTEISQAFADNSTLFAYELFHENASFNGSENNIDKYEVNMAVRDIIAHVKSQYICNIVTVGLFNARSLFKLGIKPFESCDIYNFHIYDDECRNEIGDFMESGITINRQIEYFSRILDVPDVPWFIGEVGVETTPLSDYERTETSYVVSESDQIGFVERTLNCTNSAGGLGYAYWQFQNARGWQNYGLLRLGGTETVEIDTDPVQNVTIEGTFKEIAYSYDNSVFKTILQSDYNCIANEEAYYNVLGMDEEDENNLTWYGTVKDIYGNFLDNALVRLNIETVDEIYASFYTFTNEAGNFKLSLPTPNGGASIKISKYGYNVAEDELYWAGNHGIFYLEEVVPDFSRVPSNYFVENYLTIDPGTDLIIDKPKIITDDIEVSSNASLTISANVYFASNSEITINPGGKLILEDGATLTAIKDQWQGIKVTGETGNPAEIHTAGNNTIAKALVGIDSRYNVITDINGTRFINNTHDIEAYDNYLQIKISNAYFNTTEGAYYGETEGYYTNFSNCADVLIQNTEFKDYRSWAVYPEDKTGIKAYDSKILVTSEGLNSRNTFIGMKFAISTEESDIDIKHSDFYNNMHDIDMNFGYGINSVNDCSFVVSTGYPIDDDAYNFFVRLVECDDVRVTNCEFSDNSGEAITSPLKIGIQAVNVGKLEVTPDVMANFKRTSFNNLNYGIYAVRSLFVSCNILVKQTDFNTSRGIYILNYSGFGSAKLINNDITVKKLPNLRLPNLRTQGSGGNPSPDPYEPEADELRPYGIYIDGISNDYQVEGNRITSENGDTENKFGIVTRNNGSYMNEVYRNDAYNLENSVQAIGNNRKQIVGNVEGLQILCNNFSSNKTDIYVTSGSENSNWGIAGNQGTNEQPAGNLFSCYGDNVCGTFVINNELNEFTYYTRSHSDPNYNEMETPGNEGVSENVFVTPSNEISSEEMCDDYTIIINLPININEVYSDLLYSYTLENTIDNMLDDIVDGGNTGQVLSDIIQLDDNSAWLTYYDLMYKSPYLSDTVLKDIAKKEEGLTVPMIRDILVANPQSAKKSDIKKLLKERDIQLPDYMIEQIEAGEVQISSKEYFELQKFEQRVQFEESLFTLANYYYNGRDSLPYAHDSIVSLFSIRKEPQYLYLLADYYVETGDVISAKSVVSSMINDGGLNEKQIEEANDLINLYEWYANIEKDTKADIYELDSINTAFLSELSEKGGIAGMKAKQILYMNNLTYNLEKIYQPMEYIIPRSARFGNENNTANPVFAVYPNPADNYLTVDYKLAEKKGNISIVITDLNGKLIYSESLSGTEDIVLIDLKDIPAGTYVCSLFNGNNCEFSEKFVKNK